MTVIFLTLRNDRRRLHGIAVFRQLLAKHARQTSVMQNIHVCVVLPDVVVLPRFIPPTKADHRGPASGKQILDRVAWPAKAAAADRRWVSWFNRFRDLTVSGFFSSKAGVADLPFLGNKAVAEWKGCDPGTWALIEERMKNGYKGITVG